MKIWVWSIERPCECDYIICVLGRTMKEAFENAVVALREREEPNADELFRAMIVATPVEAGNVWVSMRTCINCVE